MLQLEVLVLKLVPVDGLSSCSIASSKVSSLGIISDVKLVKMIRGDLPDT